MSYGMVLARPEETTILTRTKQQRESEKWKITNITNIWDIFENGGLSVAGRFKKKKKEMSDT